MTRCMQQQEMPESQILHSPRLLLRHAGQAEHDPGKKKASQHTLNPNPTATTAHERLMKLRIH